MMYPALDKIYLCNREIVLYVSHYDEGDHQKIKLFLDRKRWKFIKLTESEAKYENAKKWEV